MIHQKLFYLKHYSYSAKTLFINMKLSYSMDRMMHSN